MRIGESGDPLFHVTELPLLMVDKRKDAPAMQPEAFLDFKNLLPSLRLRIARGEPIDDVLGRFGVRPLDLKTALRLQLRTLSAAMEEATNASVRR